MLDDDAAYDLVSQQVDYITEDHFEYTGSGVFVYFKMEEEGKKYRAHLEHNRLNGVLVKSEEMDIGAEATISLSDGLIDFLEIWNYGDVYPSGEPVHYTLEQAWKKDESRKRIVR